MDSYRASTGMESGSGGNLLELAARTMGPPYPGSTMPGGPGATSPVAQDTRRALNGWSYGAENGGHCNFTPYSSSVSSLGSAAGGPVGSMGHKPSYAPYSTGELLGSTCGQQMPLNQLGHLQSLGPPRQFPFYGDVYQSNPGMGPGGSLFSDLSIPSIPRYDSEANAAFIVDNGAQNPGE